MGWCWLAGGVSGRMSIQGLPRARTRQRLNILRDANGEILTRAISMTISAIVRKRCQIYWAKYNEQLPWLCC